MDKLLEALNPKPYKPQYGVLKIQAPDFQKEHTREYVRLTGTPAR